VNASLAANPWVLALAGFYLFGLALWSVHTGASIMIYRSVRRTEDPTGFWTSVAVSGLLGSAILIWPLINLVR
jgi:hypothetical protein